MKFKSTLWLVVLLTISCTSSPPPVAEPESNLTSTHVSSLQKLPLHNSPKVIEIDDQNSLDIPKPIRQAPNRNVQLIQVINATNSSYTYLGTQVRWGGIIRSLHNEKGFTLVQVLAYELNNKGRPQTNTAPLGSFLVQASIPFDTVTYAKDREITVAGTVATLAQRVVAEEPSTLPLVKAEAIYMWGEGEVQAQDTFTSPHYSHNSHCHYVYEGRCYSYTPQYSKPWYSSLNYGYRDPWYRHWPWRYGRHWGPWYGYWWPRSYIHFGFYSD
jgi:outer membrane lipoprotein